MSVSYIRWGLVGASDIAETRMIPAMRRLGHDVIAVGSGNADWAATYADRNGIPASGPVEVRWTTKPGTATAGADYQDASGTVTFPAGSAEGTRLRAPGVVPLFWLPLPGASR